MEIDVMVMGAHPDDIEIGMGGTILALNAAGYNVILVDLSDGEPTPAGTHDIRMKEAAKAAQMMHVEKRVTLDMVNREIMDTVENRKKLATVMREYKPKIIFAPYWEDGHPDHIQASRLAQASRFYAKFVKTEMPFTPHYPGKLFYFFSSHLRIKMQPSFVFDISDYMDKKIEVLASYESQFVSNQRNLAVADHVRQENGYWGRQIGRKYGEPFVCQENIALSSARSLFDA